MIIKSINKIKLGYRTTIFQNDGITKQIIIECDNLQGLVDKIGIFMIKYRDKKIDDASSQFLGIHTVYDAVHKELKPLDF